MIVKRNIVQTKLKVSSMDIIFLYFITRLCFTPATVWPVFKAPLVLAIGIIGIVFLCKNHKYIFYFQRSTVFYLLFLIMCIIIEHFLATDYECIEIIDSYFVNFLFIGVFWGVYSYLETNMAIGEDSIVTKWYRLGIVISTILVVYVEIKGGGDLIRDTAVSYSTQFSFRYGGFDFIYGLLIIYTTFLASYINWKNKISRRGIFISRILLILFTIAITLSNYTTAFVLLVFSTVYCLLPKKRLVRVMLVGTLIVMFYVITPFLSVIIYRMGFLSELTKDRLSNMFLLISGQATGIKYLSGKGQRFDLLLNSVKAFFNYPFTGALTNNQRNILGGHTEWVETLARFGLLVFIPYVMVWKTAISNIINNIKKRNSDETPFKSAIFISLIIGFLDPISYLVTLAPIFLFSPFIDGFFNRYELEN